jgi:choline kinase
MKPTLLLLAAGMGSRYGGLKQLDGVGPNGETIMDYSIYDAIQAGFGKAVFVIRKDFEQEFREKILSKYEGKIENELVFQSVDALPEGFTCPKDREKPWGTNHAIMMAENAIKEPFCVINCDDFYSRESFKVIGEYLSNLKSDQQNSYAMVGFKVLNTLSENGTVSRGVCDKNENDQLTQIVERTQIKAIGNKVCYHGIENAWIEIDKDTPVSMNMWGFTPDYFKYSKEYFINFLNNPENLNNLKSEFYIPTMVDYLIKSKKATVKVLNTDAKWFGVTYAEDKPSVVERITNLIEAGEYPQKLF